MRLVWRPKALEDREAIWDYISPRNYAAAVKLDDEFEEKAELASQNPNYGKPGRVAGTREILVRKNYYLVYEVDEHTSTVSMVRVLHTSQNWP